MADELFGVGAQNICSNELEHCQLLLLSRTQLLPEDLDHDCGGVEQIEELMGAKSVYDFANFRLLENKLDNLVVHSLNELGSLLFDQVICKVSHVEILWVLTTLVKMISHKKVMIVEKGS